MQNFKFNQVQLSLWLIFKIMTEVLTRPLSAISTNMNSTLPSKCLYGIILDPNTLTLLPGKMNKQTNVNGDKLNGDNYKYIPKNISFTNQFKVTNC